MYIYICMYIYIYIYACVCARACVSRISAFVSVSVCLASAPRVCSSADFARTHGHRAVSGLGFERMILLLLKQACGSEALDYGRIRGIRRPDAIGQNDRVCEMKVRMQRTRLT